MSQAVEHEIGSDEDVFVFFCGNMKPRQLLVNGVTCF